MTDSNDKNKLKQPLVQEEASTAQASDQLPLRTELCQMSGMAIQLSTTRIVRMLLTTIDAAFLGHLGTKQLSAVSLSAMWQGVPSTFIQFCLQASTTLCSQARGAGENKVVGLWLQTALFIGLIGSIPVMAIFWNIHYIVAFTMKDEATLTFSKDFSRMMMFSIPPQFCYVAMTSFFSTIDVVMPATFCTCITVICNVAFNYVFIYGYERDGQEIFPALGFIGSPLATVVSSFLQLIMFTTYCMFIKGYHKPYWPGWTKEAISSKNLRTFMSLGLPIGLSSVVDWASGAIAGSFSGWCGFQVAAAQNVLNGLFSITYSTVSGFSTATQIRLARYLGEGKPEAAKRILKIGSTTLLMGGVIICGLVSIYHDSLWRVWTNDDALVQVCDTALAAFMAGVMMAYLRFTLTIVMSSLGSKEAYINLVSNNIASWVIYIPLAYLMPIVWNWGLPGFWWSDFFGELFKVICLAWGVSRVDWVQASMDARKKAQNSKEESEKCEELEKDAYVAMAGAYSSPTTNTGTGNIQMHSPGLMTRNAAENYNSIVGNAEGNSYTRSPGGGGPGGPTTHIEDI
jgi:MATE family multidrug resistance protein